MVFATLSTLTLVLHQKSFVVSFPGKIGAWAVLATIAAMAATVLAACAGMQAPVTLPQGAQAGELVDKELARTNDAARSMPLPAVRLSCRRQVDNRTRV